jgi:hypothetical protein
LVALPEDARTREQLEWVAGDVEAAGGSAILWRAELLSVRDEQRLVSALQQARAQEYLALATEAEQAGADSASDQVRTLSRLRRELRRIRRRDYFPPPEQELARQAVEGLSPSPSQPNVTGAGGASA